MSSLPSIASTAATPRAGRCRFRRLVLAQEVPPLFQSPADLKANRVLKVFGCQYIGLTSYLDITNCVSIPIFSLEVLRNEGTEKALARMGIGTPELWLTRSDT